MAAAACLLVGLIAHLAEAHLRAVRHERLAEEAFAERDFALARPHLAAVLRIRPTSARAHLLLAQACRRDRGEDFEGAATHLSEAKRLKAPRLTVAVETRLLDFQQHGTAGTREANVRQLLGDATLDRPAILEALARGCIRGDRLDDASAWLDRWVEYYPEDWYARLWRGTLLQHMDRPELAVQDYERVLLARPGDADAERRLGLALVQSGSDYARALRHLEAWRQGHPDDPDTLVGVARCQAVLNRPDEARRSLQTVLAADPDHADALLALALVAVDREDYPEALHQLRRLEPLAGSPRVGDAFGRLLRLEPAANSSSIPTRLRTVYHLQATVLRRLGRESDAVAYDAKLKRLEGDVADLLLAAREHARNPDDVALWYRLGTLNLRVGMRENGEYWLGRVLQADPKDRRAHRALADYYRSRTDPDSQQRAEQHERHAAEP